MATTHPTKATNSTSSKRPISGRRHSEASTRMATTHPTKATNSTSSKRPISGRRHSEADSDGDDTPHEGDYNFDSFFLKANKSSYKAKLECLWDGDDTPHEGECQALDKIALETKWYSDVLGARSTQEAVVVTAKRRLGWRRHTP